MMSWEDADDPVGDEIRELLRGVDPAKLPEGRRIVTYLPQLVSRDV